MTLTDCGIWIVRHPWQLGGYLLLAWALASVIAGIALWRQVVQDVPPAAPGHNRKRVS